MTRLIIVTPCVLALTLFFMRLYDLWLPSSVIALMLDVSKRYDCDTAWLYTGGAGVLCFPCAVLVIASATALARSWRRPQ
ncbi:hypothetical protein GS535_10905 [Saccharibacter sp. EH611]|uniref:hypothetical protein n=1 Tax=Saccharibacter sp. EH611 TaxID=2689391 RepID=UPI001325B879|nr:hypothetical protein [Saccharibacter sp. EH611]MXV37045.1 hypothetical protein [Saccharibacter sp. EH611]